MVHSTLAVVSCQSVPNNHFQKMSVLNQHAFVLVFIVYDVPDIIILSVLMAIKCIVNYCGF